MLPRPVMTSINPEHILRFPITVVSLALTHSDGTLLKTEKATLTKILESKQETVLISLPPISSTVIDGGLMLHETVIQHRKSTYGTMAKDLLMKVCLSPGEEIQVAEHKLRGLSTIHRFCITGPDQAQRQSGVELLKITSFKKQFAQFIMQEWKKPKYGQMFGNKTVFVSHGDECMKINNNDGHMQK